MGRELWLTRERLAAEVGSAVAVAQVNSPCHSVVIWMFCCVALLFFGVKAANATFICISILNRFNVMFLKAKCKRLARLNEFSCLLSFSSFGESSLRKFFRWVSTWSRRTITSIQKAELIFLVLHYYTASLFACHEMSPLML
jgi:hypothetical protein